MADAGNDKLSPAVKDLTIDGESGADTIDGGLDDDHIYGKVGADILRAAVRATIGSMVGRKMMTLMAVQATTASMPGGQRYRHRRCRR